ncbi:Probably inactive leucine-rich repeat receptor-like protein kinase IMK2 [Linum perenne]
MTLCFFSDAILDPVDFLALQSIRKSLDDMPGSNFFSTWDFTSDPCNFAGVYCDSDRVIALNLGDPSAGSPGLIGRIDPSIGKLTSLAELSIVPGRILRTIPESISQLTELRFFAVSRNFLLLGNLPVSLGQLSNLKTLDLSYNQLTGIVPPLIGSITGLSNLILCHNQLSGSVPMFTSQTLTRLDLSHNQLNNTILPSSLPTSLQYLSVSKNRLETLYLQHNYLTGIEINPTAEIPVSSSLCLQYNCMVPPVQTPCPAAAAVKRRDDRRR